MDELQERMEDENVGGWIGNLKQRLFQFSHLKGETDSMIKIICAKLPPIWPDEDEKEEDPNQLTPSGTRIIDNLESMRSLLIQVIELFTTCIPDNAEVLDDILKSLAPIDVPAPNIEGDPLLETVFKLPGSDDQAPPVKKKKKWRWKPRRRRSPTPDMDEIPKAFSVEKWKKDRELKRSNLPELSDALQSELATVLNTAHTRDIPRPPPPTNPVFSIRDTMDAEAWVLGPKYDTPRSRYLAAHPEEWVIRKRKKKLEDKIEDCLEVKKFDPEAKEKKEIDRKPHMSDVERADVYGFYLRYKEKYPMKRILRFVDQKYCFKWASFVNLIKCIESRNTVSKGKPTGRKSALSEEQELKLAEFIAEEKKEGRMVQIKTVSQMYNISHATAHRLMIKHHATLLSPQTKRMIRLRSENKEYSPDPSHKRKMEKKRELERMKAAGIVPEPAPKKAPRGRKPKTKALPKEPALHISNIPINNESNMDSIPLVPITESQAVMPYPAFPSVPSNHSSNMQQSQTHNQLLQRVYQAHNMGHNTGNVYNPNVWPSNNNHQTTDYHASSTMLHLASQSSGYFNAR